MPFSVSFFLFFFLLFSFSSILFSTENNDRPWIYLNMSRGYTLKPKTIGFPVFTRLNITEEEELECGQVVDVYIAGERDENGLASPWCHGRLIAEVESPNPYSTTICEIFWIVDIFAENEDGEFCTWQHTASEQHMDLSEFEGKLNRIIFDQTFLIPKMSQKEYTQSESVSN